MLTDMVPSGILPVNFRGVASAEAWSLSREGTGAGFFSEVTARRKDAK